MNIKSFTKLTIVCGITVGAATVAAAQVCRRDRSRRTILPAGGQLKQRHENYNGAPTDRSAWLNGGEQMYRVLRGGSWNNNATNLRSANRNRNTPDIRNNNGFRVVAVVRTLRA